MMKENKQVSMENKKRGREEEVERKGGRGKGGKEGRRGGKE